MAVALTLALPFLSSFSSSRFTRVVVRIAPVGTLALGDYPPGLPSSGDRRGAYQVAKERRGPARLVRARVAYAVALDALPTLAYREQFHLPAESAPGTATIPDRSDDARRKKGH